MREEWGKEPEERFERDLDKAGSHKKIKFEKDRDRRKRTQTVEVKKKKRGKKEK